MYPLSGPGRGSTVGACSSAAPPSRAGRPASPITPTAWSSRCARAPQCASTRCSTSGGNSRYRGRNGGDYRRVDLDRVEVLRPPSVGVEHVALETLRRLGLDVKLAQLGFNRHPLSAAIGVVVGRMVRPGSERATHLAATAQRPGGADRRRLRSPGSQPPLPGERPTVGTPCDLGSVSLPAGVRPVLADADHDPLRPDQHLLRGHRQCQPEGQAWPLQREALGLSAGDPGPGAGRQRLSQAQRGATPATSANPRHWRRCSSASC